MQEMHIKTDSGEFKGKGTLENVLENQSGCDVLESSPSMFCQPKTEKFKLFISACILKPMV